MPPKSIFRQPGAQHFQLVHRSQRDPLIHDPEASQHVLKAFVPSNIKKVCPHCLTIFLILKSSQGKSRAELETILSPSEVAHDHDAHVGEASLYGIYYDDTEYDYMQHLRAAGVQEEGVDSVLIEAPSASKSKGKSKTKADDPISLRDLPAEALPSTSELPRNYESQEAIPSSIAGFRPDMDPHLRQALEALEDDAFVDDTLDDDFFGVLVKEGERGEDEQFEYEFEDGVVEDKVEEAPAAGNGGGETWEARFAKFKKDQKEAPGPSDSDSDLGGSSEGGDTVGRLPKLPVIGGKRRRKGTSDASGYSMSSSSMFRTEALVTLDERFDRVSLVPHRCNLRIYVVTGYGERIRRKLL
jgi:protein LTV1